MIIDTDGNLEVIVETYPSYYITKYAKIVENNLIINKDSQNIKSTFNTLTTKRVFDNTYYE